ncbi:PHP domain-containing protein [Actinomycetospora lutea]|uniref:PHP domain-containing protein n=1 Tax=Actinomycetospora lutea TaxID=663604 RepID=UPI002366A32A|nr:PHP domain-containing protein [Actinomycetospora lutea]MDD7937792.1 PHP domain-containing protein [Actinomycetospora lutea]
MTIDLHTHSSVSDGTETPAELLATAVHAGVTVLALTDHDTTAGWAEAAEARPSALTLVRGAEFSTVSPDGRGGEVTAHLLGYLFDPADSAIAAEQERVRGSRRERVRAMGERMAAGGLPIDGEALLARLPADSPAGRPHIGQALLDAGVVGSVSEAFEHVLAKDGPYYVEKYNTPIATAVAMIRAAGGVAVFAHAFARRRGPCVDASVIRDLAAAGLDGVEVDHPDHGPEDRAALRDLAAETGLLVTGSSDYHGTNKTTAIAAETTAPAEFEALVGRAEERASGVEVLAGRDPGAA